MRIKNQFIICLVVFSIILVIIAVSVVTTEQQVAQLSGQEEIASSIERGASGLNSVAIDYFLYQEDLQLSKWQSAISSLSNDLSSLNRNGTQQETLTNNVAGDLQRLNSLFDDVISYLQSAPRNVSVRIDPAFQSRWSSMAVQSQALAFDSSQLSRSLDSQAHQINNTNILLVVSLVSAFGAFLATIYLIVFRRMLKSVTELQNGINTIGSGNLDYKIKTEGQNEITELSHAFNQMTTNLKTVTASKTELEAEIVGRKQAEIALRVNEQRWATTLGSIGDAVIATDLSGKITFMNGVAERLTGWTIIEVLKSPVTEVFNIINEQTRKEAENPVSRVLEKGLVVGLANHTVLIRKDGTEVAIDDSGAPIKDKDGNVTGVVLVFRDITERKKNEEKINQQALMIANANDAIIGYDLDQKVTFWNKAAEQMYGYTREEAMGKASVDLLQPTYVNVTREELINQLATTGHVETESKRSTKDGRRLNVEANVILLRNEAGKSIGYVSADRDITQRKQMQAKLEDYSKNLEALVDERTKKLELSSLYARRLIEASLDPLVTISAEGKITDVNNATELATGCSREDLIGSDFSDYFTEPEKAKNGYKQVFTKGFMRDYPLAIRHKSGKITDVLYNATVYRNEGGEVQGIFAAARDITQRKNAEERYRMLFDSIDEGFCIIEVIFDAHGKPLDYRFLDVNSSFERQTGLHAAKGKLMRTLAPNHEAFWFETYGKVATTGQSVRFTNESKALNRWYDVFAFSVGEGKIHNVAILFNDISQRKNLEKQLKDSERLATIGATAGMVGHDIRNPLQAITSDVYLVKTDLAPMPESEEKTNIQESLTEIEKNITYINKIVADLQDFARPLSPKLEEVDLEKTVHFVLSQLNIPGNVTVKHSIRKDFPKLTADESYIQRILINLSNNAIQAMPEGGKLTINAAIKKGKAVITVQDNGEGIPENVRDRLFMPLVTTKSKGQGFGLAVVKRFTEGLGGTVTFESEVGKGTIFTIELPI
jgi:PAS domain S-box-containing protein